jgi:precorrin-2 dehydrogenase/sirohydrochlorin ferrochelatase
MRYYPIGLDISGRRCLVIGGGEVGERKAQRLLECGALVTVVGKRLTRTLDGLRRKGRIDHVRADYEKGHLEGAFLVIGATDDRAVNDRIFRDARQLSVLANIVDDPERCDFILPALCRQGELVITVGTEGRSPALAKKLRRELEERYGPEYQILLKIMGEVRKTIIDRGRGADENRKVFEALVDSDILEAIRRGHWKKAGTIVKTIAGVSIDLSAIRQEATPSTSSGRQSRKQPLRQAQGGKATRQEAKKKGSGVRGSGSRGK